MELPLAIGSEFAGYRVEQLVARGGMGVVYRATSLRPVRQVALKLLAEHGGDATLQERFRRECELAASIEHPHVIPIYQADEEDGVLFIAMRWVEGTDLGALIDDRGPLAPARVVRIVEQVAEALDAAHARGLVHRDVKPPNILLTATEHVYLTDFGLTRHTDTDRALTAEGKWVGTLDYVAPEQIEGRMAGPRTDVYSLGCVMFEALTGRPPFPRDSDMATLWAHTHVPPPSITETHPGVPSALEAVVRSAMSKHPSERPGSAGELARAARAALEGGRPPHSNDSHGMTAVEEGAGRRRPSRATTGPGPATPGPAGISFPAGLRGVLGTKLFGRDREAALLERAAGEARGGSRWGVLLNGPAGIGKTALAAHAAARAHAAGAIVLYGRCSEDLDVPYKPFVEALGQYVQEAPVERLSRHLAVHGDVLTRLVPQLARRTGRARTSDTQSSGDNLYVLFAAVAGLLDVAAESEPVMLVLDDLHWADRPTWLLLDYLLTSPIVMGAVIVGTYRADETTEEMRLKVAALHNEPNFRDLALGGLAESDIARITESIARHELDDQGIELARILHRSTEGNPFFALEILRHLAESRQLTRSEGRWSAHSALPDLMLPHTVTETIERRIARLGAEIKEALSAAAVIGQDFELDLLGAALGRSSYELLDLLEPAHRAQLVALRPTAGRFSHALVQYALYEALSARTRARLHRGVAEALERMYGTEPAQRSADFARHWLEVSTPEEVVKTEGYCRRAGEWALDHFSPDDAVHWFECALEQHARRAAKDDRARCDLMVAMGTAQCHRGDAGFRETLIEAARLALGCSYTNGLVAAALANTRGFVSATGAVDRERVALLEAALNAVAADESLEHARLLSTLAAELTFSGDWERRRSLSDSALAMARRLGNQRTLGEVLSSRFMTVWTPETLAERAANTREELSVVDRGGGDLLGRFWALHWRATACVEEGRLDEARRLVEEEAGIADRLRQPRALWLAAYDRATQALISGALAEAEHWAGEAFRIASESRQPEAEPFYVAQLVNIRFEQGRLAELEPAVSEQAAAQAGIPAFLAALALAQCEADRPAAALETLTGVRARELPYDSNWLVTLAIWTEACSQAGHQQSAVQLEPLLRPYRDQIAFNSATAWGSVYRHVALVERVLGRHRRAQANLVAAAEIHAGVGAPVWLARTRVDLGTVLLEKRSRRERDEAASLLEQARAAAELHGARAVEQRAEALLAQSLSAR